MSKYVKPFHIVDNSDKKKSKTHRPWEKEEHNEDQTREAIPYQIWIGTFLNNSFTWHKVGKEINNLQSAYKAYKQYVNTQLKFTADELEEVWDTGRLDIELRQGKKLLNWMGTYSRRVSNINEGEYGEPVDENELSIHKEKEKEETDEHNKFDVDKDESEHTKDSIHDDEIDVNNDDEPDFYEVENIKDAGRNAQLSKIARRNNSNTVRMGQPDAPKKALYDPNEKPAEHYENPNPDVAQKAKYNPNEAGVNVETLPKENDEARVNNANVAAKENAKSKQPKRVKSGSNFIEPAQINKPKQASGGSELSEANNKLSSTVQKENNQSSTKGVNASSTKAGEQKINAKLDPKTLGWLAQKHGLTTPEQINKFLAENPLPSQGYSPNLAGENGGFYTNKYSQVEQEYEAARKKYAPDDHFTMADYNEFGSEMLETLAGRENYHLISRYVKLSVAYPKDAKERIDEAIGANSKDDTEGLKEESEYLAEQTKNTSGKIIYTVSFRIPRDRAYLSILKLGQNMYKQIQEFARYGTPITLPRNQMEMSILKVLNDDDTSITFLAAFPEDTNKQDDYHARTGFSWRGTINKNNNKKTS